MNCHTIVNNTRFYSIKGQSSDTGGRNRFAFGLLLLLVFTIYSNNYQCAWHFDDRPNITQNPSLRIEKFDYDSIKDTFTAQQGSSRIYRPIPMLTFAINWYLGHGKIWGFHFVNNLVHFLTAFFLFLSVQLLMQTPTCKSGQNTNPFFLALLTATLWAVHPIQTQAVTYIVQRMASMAAMFSILSIYFYLKWRLTFAIWPKIIFASFCVMSFALAVLSKENSVMLPASLILIELVFFPNSFCIIAAKKNRITFTLAVIIAVSSVIAVPIFIWHESILKVLFSIYEFRPFTMTERVFTEARILVFYLSLLFLPTYQRLSFYHQFQISTSLFDPWSTVICFGIIILLIIFALTRTRKYPLFSFSVLFFFLNHVVESSIIGLELVYEHRNYLPSLFIFLPFAALVYRYSKNYENQRSAVYWLLMAFIPMAILSIGIGTYERNEYWKTEKSLWEDALSKYPDTPRGLNCLAYGHYLKSGDLDTALALYQRSVTFSWKDDITVYQKGMTLSDMAAIYFAKGAYGRALELWDDALTEYPDFHIAMIGKVDAYMALGQWNDASQALDELIETHLASYQTLNQGGFIAFKMGNYVRAVDFYIDALKAEPENFDSLVYLGALYSAVGNDAKSTYFLKRANSIQPNALVVSLLLLENAIKFKHDELKQKYLDRIFTRFNQKQILANLRRSKKHHAVPLSIEILAPAIAEAGKLKTEGWLDAMTASR